MEQIPGNVTLAEARKIMIDHAAMDSVLGRVNLGAVARIRFLRKPEETELPDNCTMDDFRHLCSIGKAMLVIDDGGDGGLKIKAPELV